MSAPSGADIAAFLGQGDDEQLAALAEQHVTIVTAMCRAYTRGNGFVDAEPNDELAAVVTVASARLLANPEQIATTTGSVAVNGGFTGWTLAETFVLNRYRKRAQ